MRCEGRDPNISSLAPSALLFMLVHNPRGLIGGLLIGRLWFEILQTMSENWRLLINKGCLQLGGRPDSWTYVIWEGVLLRSL